MGHIDPVRSVQITPINRENMKISADWLLSPETLDEGKIDTAAVAPFAEHVMQEDGEICEVHQRGIRSSAAALGVLMQEEYEVFAFQEWVRQALRAIRCWRFRGSRAGRR